MEHHYFFQRYNSSAKSNYNYLRKAKPPGQWAVGNKHRAQGTGHRPQKCRDAMLCVSLHKAKGERRKAKDRNIQI